MNEQMHLVVDWPETNGHMPFIGIAKLFELGVSSIGAARNYPVLFVG